VMLRIAEMACRSPLRPTLPRYITNDSLRNVGDHPRYGDHKSASAELGRSLYSADLGWMVTSIRGGSAVGNQ